MGVLLHLRPRPVRLYNLMADNYSRVQQSLAYENRTGRLLTRAAFGWRVLHHVMLAVTVMAGALGFGVVGYRYLAGFGWVDSVLNASMILGGMGPVAELKTDAAKLFASAYALFSGIVFMGVASILVAPFAHRLLHRFHLDDSEMNFDK